MCARWSNMFWTGKITNSKGKIRYAELSHEFFSQIRNLDKLGGHLQMQEGLWQNPKKINYIPMWIWTHDLGDMKRALYHCATEMKGSARETDLVIWLPKLLHLYFTLMYAEFCETTGPRLRNPASDRGGEFTQHRAGQRHFLSLLIQD